MKPVVRKCDNCGKEFEVVHKNRLILNKHLFCCRECEFDFRRKQTLAKSSVICPVCQKVFHLKSSYLKKLKHEPCCSRACLAEYRSVVYQGENNPNYGNRGSKNPIWKSDSRVSPYGYILIRNEDHPFANCDGFVFEHRLVAEKYLLTEENSVVIDGQKYLSPDYVVHHIDGNKKNNAVDNLQIMTLAEHTSYHHKARKKLAS